MSDHIADAGKKVPDTIEQAARVIAETQMRLVNERNATLAREGLWPDHHFSATPKQLAQALHDAGLLAGGEPVAWLYRLNFPDEDTAWDWQVSKEKMTDERFGHHGGILETRPLYTLPPSHRG